MSEYSETQTHIPTVMDNPGSRAISRVYAEAFLNAAGDEVDGLLEEFTSFHDDVLEAQPQYARFLLGTVLGRDEKLRLIERTVAGQGSPQFVNFLRVLARHGRLDVLPSILHAAHVRRERDLGRRRVTVTSAVPLSEESQERLRERLASRLSFDPIVIPQVDPKVLGGLVIQVGDTVHDTSLRARLSQLRSKLRQRSLHEIQSGRDRFRHSA